MSDSGNRSESARSVWLQMLVLALLFLGGGVAGVGISERLAPDSILASFVGLFTFPVPFVVGMQAWLGLALGIALWRTAVRGPALPGQRTGVEIPAGSIVFVPVSAALVGAAGLLIGILGSSLGILATLGLYVLLGLGYGTACWLAARSGYLPFPLE